MKNMIKTKHCKINQTKTIEDISMEIQYGINLLELAPDANCEMEATFFGGSVGAGGCGGCGGCQQRRTRAIDAEQYGRQHQHARDAV